MRPFLLALVPILFAADASAGAFDGCGQIVSGVTCPLLFLADGGGLYLTDADYSASGLGVGDRLRIVGDLDTTCFTTCGQVDGCIFLASILPDNCVGLGTNYCGPAVVNSSGAAGVLGALGSATAADNNLTLVASDLPDGEFGYLLCSQGQGFIPGPGGSMGNLCLGGTIGRFTAQISQITNNQLSISVDLTALPLSPPVAAQAGETWNFQCWFRDNVGGVPTSNFTNGLSLAFV